MYKVFTVYDGTIDSDRFEEIQDKYELLYKSEIGYFSLDHEISVKNYDGRINEKDFDHGVVIEIGLETLNYLEMYFKVSRQALSTIELETFLSRFEFE